MFTFEHDLKNFQFDSTKNKHENQTIQILYTTQDHVKSVRSKLHYIFASSKLHTQSCLQTINHAFHTGVESSAWILQNKIKSLFA